MDFQMRTPDNRLLSSGLTNVINRVPIQSTTSSSSMMNRILTSARESTRAEEQAAQVAQAVGDDEMRTTRIDIHKMPRLIEQTVVNRDGALSMRLIDRQKIYKTTKKKWKGSSGIIVMGGETYYPSYRPKS